MKIFWFIIYNIFVIPIIYIGAYVAALFSPKVKQGLQGRKNSLPILSSYISDQQNKKKCILFHCASMGEFEQIRPVLRTIREKKSDYSIVVSFFSPSGFENVNSKSDYNLKIYLPFDTIPSIRKFLNMLKPKLLVISKHDVWPNLVWALSSRKIPSMLVNGTMPGDSKMTMPLVRNFFKASFSSINFIAPASHFDAEGFSRILPVKSGIQILGDTRYDQVLNRANESIKSELISEQALQGRMVFVAGSTWASDEKHLIPALIQMFKKFTDLFVILVPHELKENHLNELASQFSSAGIRPILFSYEKRDQELSNHQILIVDKMGLLANLYFYGDVAFVGGSFGPGVHNVMEPAAHGIPVLFGPRILNSPDALELQKREAGFLVRNSDDIYFHLCGFFSNRNSCKEAGKRARNLVEENQGATERISQKILTMLESTELNNPL